jgi:hypothetical protein
MPRRIAVISLAATALAFAGCGGTNKAASTGTTSEVPPGQRPVKPATYTANLAGFKKGSPNGSGLAVLTLTPSRQICWRFSQLKNITKPTVARVFRYLPFGSGANGFPLGRAYKPSGCVHVPKSAPLLGLIENVPQEWYVSIHTASFPAGAIRGPL